MANTSSAGISMVYTENEIQEEVQPEVQPHHENPKSSKFWFYVVLCVIPDLFFVSFSIYIIKMRASDYVRCEIKELENTSWSFSDIKEISQIAGFHKECSIYKFDYSKVANMSFENAKEYVNLQRRTVVKCKKFVISEHKYRNYTLKYQNEFADYCESLLEYDIVYDSVASLVFVLSCLFILPFADICGRKRILHFGWYLACASMLCRISSMNSGRNIIATMFLNAAYPVLKLATQTIIFEISNGNVLPVTFMFTFMGSSICLTVFGVIIPPMEWSFMKLLVFSTFLALPVMLWYLPESSMWLMIKSIKNRSGENKSETLKNRNNDDSDDMYLELLNERLNFKILRKHFQELRSGSFLKYISLLLVSFGVGSSNYYSISKPKFLYHYFEQKWTRVFNYLNTMHAAVISTLSIYMFGSKISLVIFLITSTFCYVYLYIFTSASPYEVKFIVMVFFVEIFTTCTHFLYQFYLAEIFPTSHRCTYTGIFNAIINLGYLITCCIHLKNVFFSEIITTLANLSGCIALIMFTETSQSNHPQMLNIVNF